MASIIKAHTPTIMEVWCGITGRVPGTPLNVLRWKSNLLTCKKRLSSLFLLNFECNIALICHCGAERDILDQRKVYIFSILSTTVYLQNFFLLQLYKFLFVFFVLTRENLVILWIKKKKQNEIKCQTTLNYLGSISTWPYLFINLEGILEK